MRTALVDLAQHEIENIYIFVADSVRLDATPNHVLSKGASGHCISPSIWTASSMPSILSGKYPANVGIVDFGTRLPNPSPLFDFIPSASLAAPTIWTGVEPGKKPPQKLLHFEDYRSLREIEPPFVHVEHDKGGHSPYGYTFEECDSEKEFFANRISSIEDIPDLYQRSVDHAAERFCEQLRYLENKGILKNTLAIFTSDHGEVLGRPSEGAMIGHSQPLIPDLVDVPIVFAGAGIPDISLDGIYSGVDIVPTAQGALQMDRASTFDGLDAWNDRPIKERLVRSEVLRNTKVQERTIRIYQAHSVWDEHGGRVQQKGRRLARITFGAISQYLKGSKGKTARRGLSLNAARNFLNIYGKNHHTYGEPEFDWYKFDDTAAIEFTSENHNYEQRDIQNQLEALGYK